MKQTFNLIATAAGLEAWSKCALGHDCQVENGGRVRFEGRCEDNHSKFVTELQID